MYFQQACHPSWQAKWALAALESPQGRNGGFRSQDIYTAVVRVRRYEWAQQDPVPTNRDRVRQGWGQWVCNLQGLKKSSER